MEEYIFILEQLQKLHIEEKLTRLSEKFADKKVVLFGANNALDAICSGFDLKKYFNIIGISDEAFSKENIFQYNGFKVISMQNIYFSGVEVLINLKDEFASIENNFRKNRLVKKKVKIVHLLEKSFVEKYCDLYQKLVAAFEAYKSTKKVLPILKNFCILDNVQFLSSLNYKKIISKLNGDKKPIRVLFTVQEYETWNLQKLYDKMKSDENFKILPIVALPPSLKTESKTEAETIEYFKNKNMDCVDGFEYSTNEAVMIKALKPDIVFYQQPEFIKSDFAPKEVSNYALTCFAESEFSIMKNKKLNTNFMQDRLNNTWKTFDFNDFGFAGFEFYKDDVNPEFENVWHNSELAKNRIIYAPFYSINENFHVDKFKEQQQYIYEFAKTHPQYSFVVIPHKNFKDKCLEKNIYTIEEITNLENMWKELPNIEIVDSVNRFEVYKTSDILLTDCINFASEYFPTAKPVLLLENNFKPEFTPFGEKCFKTFYRLNSLAAIEILLEDILVASNDYNAQNRNLVISKNDEIFEKCTSELIMNYLKTEFNRIEINT